VHSSGGLKLDEPLRSTIVAAAAERLVARRTDIRVAAIQLLGNWASPHPQSVPAIALLAWNDPAPSVRHAALRALAPLDGMRQAELVELASGRFEPVPQRRMALHLLADKASAGPAERSAMVALLNGEPSAVLRLAALRVLLVVGDRCALEPGLALLGENDLAADPDAQTELAACTLAELLPLVRAVLESDLPHRGRIFAALLPLDRADDMSNPLARSVLTSAAVSADLEVRAHTKRLLGELSARSIHPGVDLHGIPRRQIQPNLTRQTHGEIPPMNPTNSASTIRSTADGARSASPRSTA
jgi:hypothetical protein